MTVEAATKVIKGQSLRYTPPEEFDDIFELTNPGLIENSDTVNSLSSKKERIRAMISGVKFNHEAYLQLRELKKQIGVCCFSDSFDINIMWSLYAQKHKGVVLGIRSNCLLPIMPVTYFSPENETEKFSSILEAARYMVFTKTHDWEWQREYRTIELLNNMEKVETKEGSIYLKSIPYEAIEEIYVGTASNEVYSTVDHEHLLFEKEAEEHCVYADIYACMKSLTERGKIDRTLIHERYRSPIDKRIFPNRF